MLKIKLIHQIPLLLAKESTNVKTQSKANEWNGELDQTDANTESRTARNRKGKITQAATVCRYVCLTQSHRLMPYNWTMNIHTKWNFRRFCTCVWVYVFTLEFEYLTNIHVWNKGNEEEETSYFFEETKREHVVSCIFMTEVEQILSFRCFSVRSFWFFFNKKGARRRWRRVTAKRITDVCFDRSLSDVSLVYSLWKRPS